MSEEIKRNDEELEKVAGGVNNRNKKYSDEEYWDAGLNTKFNFYQEDRFYLVGTDLWMTEIDANECVWQYRSRTKEEYEYLILKLINLGTFKGYDRQYDSWTWQRGKSLN